MPIDIMAAMPTRAKAPADEPVTFATPKAWATWLRKHHASSTGIWVRIAKKGTPDPSVTYLEAVDEALCWGWIDAQKKGVDEHWWQQRFTPRAPRSIWSKINRDKVAALVAAGRMQAPGAAAVERAKGNGQWDAAYDSPRAATVPDDLAAALAASKQAAAAFSGLDGANRYAILFRLQTAKKAETRARRITELVAMLARAETLHPVSARRTAPGKRKA
jgi:uncharacterized protein YdeI (YjbR/CyaY-like superfamily)